MLAAAAAAAVYVATRGPSSALPAGQPASVLVLQASPLQRAFVDNADDRVRGDGDNPFGNYRATLGKAATSEQASGPFPGDEGLFSYRLAGSSPGSAVLVCEYGFARLSVCQAEYSLARGTLTASGTFAAGANAFVLSVTGGTGAYAGARGEVRATAAGAGGDSFGLVVRPHRLRIAIRLPERAATTQTSAYSATAAESFVHNGDDEARGASAEPFRTSPGIAKAARGGRSRPVPGDQAVFRFAVYADAGLARRIGSGTFLCRYLFASDALCDVAYALPGGTVVAQGVFGFAAEKISLAVTGGTGFYRAATGEVRAVPAARHAQQVDFELRAS
jgi:hypothetical protein